MNRRYLAFDIETALPEDEPVTLLADSDEASRRLLT